MAMTLTAAIMMMGNGTDGGIRMAGGMGGGTLCRVGVGTSSNCCSDSAVVKWKKLYRDIVIALYTRNKKFVHYWWECLLDL